MPFIPNMQTIDIEHIIRTRTGRRIPAPAAAVLKRLIHQRELNDMLASGSGLEPRRFIGHVLRRLEITYSASGLDRIGDGRFIFAANHPFGGLDGMILAHAMLGRWPQTRVVVNDMLMNVEPLAPLWIPVNKYGRQNQAGAGAYDGAFAAADSQILTFPAGFCSRRIGGRVNDTEWRPRFVRDAVRYGRRVVPVFVEGRLSSLFYAIYTLRRMLHVDANIELLLLVDEMFRGRGKHVALHFGTPVDVAQMDGTADARCAAIRKMCYELHDL